MKSKELKIGILTLVALVVGYFGFNYLKGSPLLNNGNVFYAIYENVDGLHVGSKVVLNGFPVGRVNDIYLAPDGSNALAVKFTVNNADIKVPYQTQAAIISTDLFGSKAIDLAMGNTKEYHVSGDTLNGEEAASMFAEIEEKIKPYEEDFKDLKTKVDSTLIGLNATITQLNLMLSAEGQKIGEITSNVASITRNLEQNNAHISATLENIHTLSDSLSDTEIKEMIAHANVAMKNASEVMMKLNSDTGTLGKILTDSSLYTNLNQSTIALEALLTDMQAHPKRYVHFSLFGGKEKEEKKNKSESIDDQN